MNKTAKKYKLLQDVYVFQNGKYIKTFIVSTMAHKIADFYLVAGIGKPIHEFYIFSIKEIKEIKKTQTI